MRRQRPDPAKFDLTHPCPHCGYKIKPSELIHVDGENIKCPQCQKISAYGKKAGASERRKLDEGVYYSPPGTLHYNVFHKGGFLQPGVTARGFRGLSPADIDWIYIVEEKRRATQQEIKKLSSGRAGRTK